MAIKNNLLTWFGISISADEFAECYRVELPRVYNFFRYRVGDGPLAEDLTSRTFEKAWRGRARYRRDLAAFSTWLFTIARRVAQDHYRQHHGEHTPVEVSLEEIVHLAGNAMTEERVERQADFARLSVLLARLADRERELVALKYGAGLTNRAIAQLTGLSESNVGVILHRTVENLRAGFFRPEGEGHP